MSALSKDSAIFWRAVSRHDLFGTIRSVAERFVVEEVEIILTWANQFLDAMIKLFPEQEAVIFTMFNEYGKHKHEELAARKMLADADYDDDAVYRLCAGYFDKYKNS